MALPPLLQWLAQERNWVWTHESVSRLARERNWVWTCGSVSQRAVDYVGSPFSREQCLYPSLLKTSQKVAMYGDCPQEAYTERTWTDVGSIRVVLVGFSPAWCTLIRIAATLGYE
jgi:hypothetical protein